LGLTTLGTLHERIGDTLLTPGSAGLGGEGADPSGWARVIGQQIDNRYQAFADPSAKGQLIGVEAGFDLWRGSFIAGHRDVTGVYTAYLNSNVDVDGLVTNSTFTGYTMAHTGTSNLNSYSLGAYWTHYGPGDWYLDAVLQGTRYIGNATAPLDELGITANLGTRGTGFVSSLEGGYPVPLPLGPNFIIEPQAQIIWQHVDFDQASDGLETVQLGSTSGTTGRLGLRAQWTIQGDNGTLWQPYGRFNLWQDWGGAAATTFTGSGVQVPLVDHATRVEFAGGLTFKINDYLSTYVQAGYQFAIAPSNTTRDGVKGDLGLRFNW
jgi:outer membrane autotransporter protein